jgi:integrase/recombinase XerD
MGAPAMSHGQEFPALLQQFFTQRLMAQRQVSPHTIQSYRDTFRLLLTFVSERLHKAPSKIELSDLNPETISAFLHNLDEKRGNRTRTRNLRLTAIRSFFRFAAYQTPEQLGLIQRVLAIPNKRHEKKLVGFLSRPEVDALLAAPNRATWAGRRDHAFLLTAVQTGLRVSEMTGLCRSDVVLRAGAHIHCSGKGRKERCTPLTKQAVGILRSWLREPQRSSDDFLFPNARGKRMSSDGVAYLLSKHLARARVQCPSLRQKRVTPHVLRHTAAMELLMAGVDRSVIALWLGHESVETTQMYLEANLALKEKVLASFPPTNKKSKGRFHADDRLMEFLKSL